MRTIAIEALAYELWERAGKPEGRDLEFWALAEAEIAARAVPVIRLFAVEERR